SNILVTSIAIAPDGVLYAADYVGPNTMLYRLDPATAFATPVGMIPATVWGIDFGPDGTLYGASSELVTIDRNAAQVISHVGSLGSAFVLDMDFAPDGFLYAASHYKLYRINPATAATVEFGNYDSDNWGLASQVVWSDGPGVRTVTLGVGQNVSQVNF